MMRLKWSSAKLIGPQSIFGKDRPACPNQDFKNDLDIESNTNWMSVEYFKNSFGYEMPDECCDCLQLTTSKECLTMLTQPEWLNKHSIHITPETTLQQWGFGCESAPKKDWSNRIFRGDTKDKTRWTKCWKIKLIVHLFFFSYQC